jgi:hypothetical protein
MGGTAEDPGPQAPEQIFTHPGTLNNQAQLDFVSSQLALDAEPWSTSFKTVSLIANKAPSGLTLVNSSDDSDANRIKSDAQAMYAAALSWHYTGDVTYAEKAAAQLRAWSQLENFTAGSDQDKLLAGWIGTLMGPAADLLLTYEDWPAEEIAATRAMFKRAFYPHLVVASSWNGNVDLTQIQALLAIAVFNEDQESFDLGIKRLETRMPAYFYLTSDGTVTGNWHNPAQWLDGLTQETCRDNGHHAQFALAAALAAAEIAWHQGVDVYEIYQERLTSAMELLASQLNTFEMQDACTDNETTASRYNTFEIGYNHYATRLGMSLPETAAVLENETRGGRSDWNIFYETLTHGDLPAPPL